MKTLLQRARNRLIPVDWQQIFQPFSTVSDQERAELEQIRDKKLIQLAAGSALAMLPLCIAVLFGATPRNIPFPEVRIAAKIIASAGIALSCFGMWCSRSSRPIGAPFLLLLVPLWMIAALAVLCHFVAESQTRSVLMIQLFPDIGPVDLYPKVRAITGAMGASNFGLIGAFGFATLTLSALPTGGLARVILFGISQGLLVYAIGSRPERQFFLTLAFTVTTLGALSGFLRFRNILMDGKRVLLMRQLKEREAVLEYEHELDLAAGIHLAIAPPRRWKSNSRVEVQSFFSTRQKVGGEWLAIRETKQGDLIFAVASVEGAGLQAALIAHSIASIWSVGEGQQEFEAENFLKRVNSALNTLSQKQKHVASMALVQISNGQLNYWCAGHGPLHIVAQEVKTLTAKGTKLGIAQELALSTSTVTLSTTEKTDLILGGSRVTQALGSSEGETIALLELMRRHGVEAIERVQTGDDLSVIWAHYDPGILQVNKEETNEPRTSKE